MKQFFSVLSLASILTLGILFFSSSNAKAQLLWTLNGASLTGGDTLTGSFVFNAATNLYSSISIDETDPITTHYDSVSYLVFPANPEFAEFLHGTIGTNHTGGRVFLISFSSNLTNGGKLIDHQFRDLYIREF